MDNASLITGFASDGDMPSVPRPTLGMLKAVDANDVKLIILMVDDRTYAYAMMFNVIRNDFRNRCLRET